MYSLGSVGSVGSWFFISATSSVRKSFAVMVALLSVAAELELLVLLVLSPIAALGFANALATLAAEFATCGPLVTIC
jgi:hypothetical protein